MTIDEMDGEWTYVYRKPRHIPPRGYWHGGWDPRWERDRAPYPPYIHRGRFQQGPLQASRVRLPPAPPRGTLGHQTQQRGTSDTPTDPEFGQMVRLLYKGIKMVHHIDNVTPREGLPGPRTVTRTVTQLANLIQPASPTPSVLDGIGENAKVWGQNTLQILEDHYRSSLDSVLLQITAKPLSRWREAFKIATKWAHRNLPRIRKEVLDHAEAVISVCVEELEEPQPASPPPQTTTKKAQSKPTSSTPRGRDASTSTLQGPTTTRETSTPAPTPTPQSKPQVGPVSGGQDPEQSLTPIQPSRLALPRDSPSSGSVGAEQEASYRVGVSPGEASPKELHEKALRDLSARIERRRKTRATYLKLGNL